MRIFFKFDLFKTKINFVKSLNGYRYKIKVFIHNLCSHFLRILLYKMSNQVFIEMAFKWPCWVISDPSLKSIKNLLNKFLIVLYFFSSKFTWNFNKFWNKILNPKDSPLKHLTLKLNSKYCTQKFLTKNLIFTFFVNFIVVENLFFATHKKYIKIPAKNKIAFHNIKISPSLLFFPFLINVLFLTKKKRKERQKSDR